MFARLIKFSTSKRMLPQNESSSEADFLKKSSLEGVRSSADGTQQLNGRSKTLEQLKKSSEEMKEYSSKEDDFDETGYIYVSTETINSMQEVERLEQSIERLEKTFKKQPNTSDFSQKLSKSYTCHKIDVGLDILIGAEKKKVEFFISSYPKGDQERSVLVNLILGEKVNCLITSKSGVNAFFTDKEQYRLGSLRKFAYDRQSSQLRVSRGDNSHWVPLIPIEMSGTERLSALPQETQESLKTSLPNSSTGQKEKILILYSSENHEELLELIYKLQGPVPFRKLSDDNIEDVSEERLHFLREQENRLQSISLSLGK